MTLPQRDEPLVHGQRFRIVAPREALPVREVAHRVVRVADESLPRNREQAIHPERRPRRRQTRMASSSVLIAGL